MDSLVETGWDIELTGGLGLPFQTTSVCWSNIDPPKHSLPLNSTCHLFYSRRLIRLRRLSVLHDCLSWAQSSGLWIPIQRTIYTYQLSVLRDEIHVTKFRRANPGSSTFASSLLTWWMAIYLGPWEMGVLLSISDRATWTVQSHVREIWMTTMQNGRLLLLFLMRWEF